jgi:hypothetical protein
LLGGGDVKEEQFNEDKERLEYWYHSNGYRDMHVAGIELAPGSAPNRLVLKVTVEEGPLYDIGKVTFSGNKVISTPELDRMWGWKMGRYDVSKIDRTRGAAYSEYAERGYLYVGDRAARDGAGRQQGGRAFRGDRGAALERAAGRDPGQPQHAREGDPARAVPARRASASPPRSCAAPATTSRASPCSRTSPSTSRPPTAATWT